MKETGTTVAERRTCGQDAGRVNPRLSFLLRSLELFAAARIRQGARATVGWLARPVARRRSRRLQRRAEEILGRHCADDLFQLFNDADDDLWLWMHTEGRRALPLLAQLLPGLPPEALQLQFTGRSGDETLTDGYRNYRLFHELARTHLGELSTARVLDFGCGWGRILRFFVRDVRAQNLIGVDCEPIVIEFCRKTNPSIRCDLVDPLPPTVLSTGSFDFIYSYSVFSHLSEHAHLEWLREFHRILRPDGLLAVTTRPREFIVHLAELRRRSRPPASLPNALLDAEDALRAYDAGSYCHTPTGGGGTLHPSFFGETAIPRSYVATKWTKQFELIAYIDDHVRCEQNFILTRRRP
jgi:SAM-dependent methyltransferase